MPARTRVFAALSVAGAELKATREPRSSHIPRVAQRHEVTAGRACESSARPRTQRPAPHYGAPSPAALRP